MSEKIITHYDIENKQLEEENKKWNVNENENENEKLNLNENENESEKCFKNTIVKGDNIK